MLYGVKAADGRAEDGGRLTHDGVVGVQQLTHVHRVLVVHLERDGPRHTDRVGPGGDRERPRFSLVPFATGATEILHASLIHIIYTGQDIKLIHR